MKHNKRPLRLGDRVRVFSHYGPYDGVVCEIDVISHNRYRVAEGLVLVKTELGERWQAHPRQCVRLRKKLKPADRWKIAIDKLHADKSSRIAEVIAEALGLDWGRLK